MAPTANGRKRPFASIGEHDEDNDNLHQATRHSISRESVISASIDSHQRRNINVDGIPSTTPSTCSTARNTPTPAPPSIHSRRAFKTDASIVLLGMPGTGKSTLAVIASMACRRRVVDIDDVFQETTGFSTIRYRKQFGAANYNLRQEELLRTALRVHDKGAIIVCNGASLERNGQAVLQEFTGTHPVVHVLRDLSNLHCYLGGPDMRRLKDMLAFTAPVLRRCSNYEFFNISEIKVTDTDGSGDWPVAPAFLTLKRAQRTFLKFLSLITSPEDSDDPTSTLIPPLEPGYPLSDVATELRRYTCAVQVPLEDLLAESVDIQNLEAGSDAFEVVLDLSQQRPAADLMDDISSCMSKVRRSTVVPIIYHVLPTSTTDGSRLLYLEHVWYGLRLAPEYATVDLSLEPAVLAEVIASRGSTKIIGHLHVDKLWEDTVWITHYENAVRLGCSVVRFTRPAESVDDDISVRSFCSNLARNNARVPLICYNTGRAGRRSVCFNQHLTPVVAASTRDNPNALASTPQYPRDSWITAKEVTQALYTSCTFDPMQMYIIGARLEYSVSPAMHNAAYTSCGMPHEFIPIQSASLNSLKELVRKPSFGGSIVIQPFKMEVIALADSLSRHARAIGAVNTLIPVRHLNDDGSVPSDLELFQERNQSGPIQALYGDNTEWIGIRSCVRRGLSPANAVQPTSCGLVVGAGGMARAAVYALLQLGVNNIAVFNRTWERAESIVAHFARLTTSSTGVAVGLPVRLQVTPNFTILKSRDEPWPQHLRQPTMILSCIPTDPIDDTPAAHFTLPQQWMQSPTGGVVMETAYKTLNTPLMQQVRDASTKLWTYMDGLDFLPEQAFAQFELFTGKRAPRRVMREEALCAWRDEQGNTDLEMVRRRLKALDDQDP
ncbi:hypothetical protein BDW02DRAFT_567277 [Decorospora gaudefroyi]|uniref:Uncharacterized protein n=1 Tax=Decorospora gaudefroyi TaxID=184978 RepID=A0A6A5KLQ0_9PLEO|nr:hypothetical protein BDW02DRAFT_567277 [Decorospora gaudefroyi]